MAKEILSEIIINGKKLTHFNFLSINQQFNNHHSFEISIREEVLEKSGGRTVDESQELIGKDITIMFGERKTSDNIFKGIITELSMHQSNGLWGNIILKGYSPTYLWENGEHYTSFYKKNLPDIVNQLVEELPTKNMKVTVNPKYKREIPYTTQYGESNFTFITRLAIDYGEWFFYDGQELFFGKPAKQETITLHYGDHISTMNFSMRVIPGNVSHYSYNSKNDEVSSTEPIAEVDNADSYTSKMLSISDTLFPKPVNQPVGNIRTDDKSQLDIHAKKQKGVQASSMVVFTAQTDYTQIKLGAIVKIEIVEGASIKTHGEYMITSVRHQLSDTGEYNNNLEAIPSGNNYIPLAVDNPVAETQMAIVKDNADPENIGRVRVQMLWQEKTGELTDWIRVLTPDAGSSDKVNKNRGFVFIPEIDDQILVGFRYNDPNRPFVLGSMFHGKIAKGGGNLNSVKSIMTRSGHSITLDDSGAGTSITIEDPGGNTIYFDTEGKNITITAPETMTLNAKNLVINVKENMTTRVGKEMKTTVGANHTLSIDEKHEISSKETNETVDGNKTVMIEGKLKLNAASSKMIAEKGDFFIHSSKIATLQGESDAKINKG